MWLPRIVARCRSAWWTARLKRDARRHGGRVELKPTVRLRVRVIFRGQGQVTLGDHVTLGDPDAGMPGVPILLSPRRPGAHIAVGAGARFTNGVELTAFEQIKVGADCLLGVGTRIVDADFHGLAPEERRVEGRSAPVNVGVNVWLGMGVTVLKGVCIGDDAVVGAGSVVVRDVLPGGVVMGNPARLISNVRAAETA